MLRLPLTLLFLVGHVDPAGAGSPDPKSLVIPSEELGRARVLVQQLASEQYPEREKAEFELAKMGRLARPVLVEAANTNPSQEVRARCTALLPRATALDLRARLDVFLADTEGKYEHDLPGWISFRSAVRGEWSLLGHDFGGDRSRDRAARGVFADLVSTHANLQLIVATTGPATELSSMVAARRLELYSQRFPRAVVLNGRLVRPSTAPHNPSTEDIATLLFAESLVPSRVFVRAASMTSLISASSFSREVNTTGEKAKVYRALAVAWLESRTDPAEMYQCMSIASTLGLSEHGCDIAIRLLSSPGVVGTYRGMAATTLARIGNKDMIPRLEQVLADSTVAYTIQRPNPTKPNTIERHDVQARDMALAAAVILSGQKLEDYGFVDAYRGNGGISNTSYSYNRYYIPDDRRKAMHEKWKARPTTPGPKSEK